MTKSIDTGALAIMLGLSATVLAGCQRGESDWRICQGPAGTRAADQSCSDGSGGNRWVYVHGHGAPAVGAAVLGAMMAPIAGARYSAAPAEGIARGGFGGIGAGHAGGEAGE